ncbi:MAG: PAS domain-containing sensor histidine kinase, partial [Desulfocapsa sp.]|nr:PAS domain-containing sensor histidine kinase [Desulfocapsa sp.]
AHEINNPLGVILCYTDIIKDNENSDKAVLEDVSIIERHAENCRRIVADLLNFSRGSETGIEKHMTSVNVIIENVLAMVHQQLKKSNITVDSDFDSALPESLIDCGRIQQVILNLILNGIQAIETSGTLTIRTGFKNSKIIIDIEDDGTGVSKDIQDKIFDPFFSTKAPGQGTGLGLAVSYGIIHEHDGDIRVITKAGKGAHFRISLPTTKELAKDE